MPSLDACSASGMIEASPGCPIIAMPSGFAATASRSCCTIFSIAQPEKTYSTFAPVSAAACRAPL